MADTDTLVSTGTTAEGAATTVVPEIKPVSSEIAAMLDKEFDREPDPPVATLPPETWDEEKEDKGEKDEPAAEAAEGSEVVEESSDTEAEPENADGSGLSLQEKAAAWDKVVDAWSRDPAGTLQKYLSAMPETDRQRLLEAIGAQTAPAAEEQLDFPDAPETPFEEVLLKRKDWVLHGEKQVADMLAQQVESFRPLVDNIWYLNAQQAVLEELLATVSSGLPAPSDDLLASIIQDVQSGKAATFREAVKKRYAPVLSKAVSAKKQAEKPRPSTPANETAPVTKIREGMSMLEIAELLGVK